MSFSWLSLVDEDTPYAAHEKTAFATLILSNPGNLAFDRQVWAQISG
jgi:hypothetical protein